MASGLWLKDVAMARTRDNRIHMVRSNRARPRRRGVVLVMTLLALVLLVGLIFYVYNLSQQVNSRLSLQHSADSTAISGAVWMARSMNQVAMNNVAQTKLLASVIVLDSLPLATEMALEDATAWEAGLATQLRGGLPSTPAREAAFVRVGLESLRDRMETQRDILRAMNESIKDFPMERLTFYADPGGDESPYGELWRASLALSEFSQATALSSGVLAQNNAVRWGKENDAPVRTAFVTPIRPVMPSRVGTFRDFWYPLGGREAVYSDRATNASPSGGGRRSGMGGAIPDMVYPYRLGPWARLHRWREPIYSGGTWIPGNVTAGSGGMAEDDGVAEPGGGRSVGSDASRTQGGGGRWTHRQEVGYWPKGPLHWALEHLGYWAGPIYDEDGRLISGQLPDTFFSEYTNRLSRAKLRYMFFENAPQTIHKPNWITSYSRACLIAETEPETIYQTMFYVIEIVSSVSPGSARWLTTGTFRTNVPPPDDTDHRPITLWVRGWYDPEVLTRVGNHVWRKDSYYRVVSDPEIGIYPKDADNDGELDLQLVYRRRYYVWGGVDIGKDVEIRNPCNWPEGATLPVPLLLATNPDEPDGDYDPYTLDPDAGYRRRFFTFLGTAQMDTPPLIMGGAFGTGSPNGKTVAVAQAKVFNASSFDLWTQDWDAALMPVTNMDDWLDNMARDAHQATATNGLLAPSDVMDAHDHLRKLGKEMMRRQTKH